MIDRRHLLAAFPMLWMAARAGALLEDQPAKQSVMNERTRS